VIQYQKGKANVDFTEARDSEWQWHQLSHMQVCISLQTDNHATTPPLATTQFFTGWMPFLLSEGKHKKNKKSELCQYCHITPTRLEFYTPTPESTVICHVVVWR